MFKCIPSVFTLFVMFMINVNAQTDVKPPLDKPDPVIETVVIPFFGCVTQVNSSATVAEIEAVLGMSIQAYIIYLQGMLANDPNNLRLIEQIAYYQGFLAAGDKPEPTIIEH